MRPLLKFGIGSAKLDEQTATFSIPAGWTCPGAKDCLARVKREGGKGSLSRGPHTRFSCYAATMELRHKSVRDSRWNNFELLEACTSEDQICQLLHDSIDRLPAHIQRVRVDVGGDLYKAELFRAWMRVARHFPQLFYAYTKSLHFWVQYRHLVPGNFKLNASKGGKFDHLIAEHGLKYAEVVFSVAQAEALGLELDHHDRLAWSQDKSFALLLHGTQEAGTPAAKALGALKAAGFTGYGRRTKIAA